MCAATGGGDVTRPTRPRDPSLPPLPGPDTGPTLSEQRALVKRQEEAQRAAETEARTRSEATILKAIIRQGYSWPGEDH